MIAAVVFEHAIKTVLFNGPAVEVTLNLVATAVDKESSLLLRLNALGNHLQLRADVARQSRDVRRPFGDGIASFVFENEKPTPFDEASALFCEVE